MITITILFLAYFRPIWHICNAIGNNTIMMTSWNGNIFRITGPFLGGFTGHRWTPLTKASVAELWCFLWSVFEQTLCRQSRRREFETTSRSVWRHYNDVTAILQVWWISTLTLTSLFVAHYILNEHGSDTVQSKTMQCYSYPVSLLDQPNAYWVIVLTSYSGTICVLNKLEDLGQYHPHAKPSKMMSVYSYPARLVNTPYGVSIVKSCRESWLH